MFRNAICAVFTFMAVGAILIWATSSTNADCPNGCNMVPTNNSWWLDGSASYCLSWQAPQGRTAYNDAIYGGTEKPAGDPPSSDQIQEYKNNLADCGSPNCPNPPGYPILRNTAATSDNGMVDRHVCII